MRRSEQSVERMQEMMTGNAVPELVNPWDIPAGGDRADAAETGAAAPEAGMGAAAVSDADHARASNDDATEQHQSTSKYAAAATGRGEGRVAASGSRINPDDFRFIRAITLGVLFAGLVAFAISFVALMEVAAWLGLPDWMHWAVPAFIDTAIVVYAGSVLIHKARGETTWPSWLMLAAFTALSMVANAAHALSYANSLQHEWQSWVGVAIAAMVPIAVFTATEQLSRVAVEDPVSRRRELEAAAEWHAAQAERERKQLEVEAARERARQEAELESEEHRTRLEEVRAQREARARLAKEQAERGQLELPYKHLQLVSDSGGSPVWWIT